MSDSSSDSLSDDEECDILGKMHLISDCMEQINMELKRLEDSLELLKRPIQLLELNQLDNLQFLENSPFRFESFHTKQTILNIDPEKRYPYHIICKLLRDYLFQTNAVQTDGTIHVSKELQTAFRIKESNITYIQLLKYLRNVLE